MAFNYEQQSAHDELLYDYKWRQTAAGSRTVGDTFLAMLHTLQADGTLRRGHILDLGCGPGRHTLAALEAGFQVTAIDHNSTAMSILRERALGTKSLTISETNFGEWLDAASGSYAAVICWDAVHHLSSDVKVIRHALLRMTELVAPNGYLLVTLLCDTEYELGATGRQLEISHAEGLELLEEVCCCHMHPVTVKWKRMATDDSIGVDRLAGEICRARYSSTRIVGLFHKGEQSAASLPS